MLKLSFDIVFVLFDLLDPLDILFVGQTCKTLREWSSIRSVWIKALDRVIETNSLFKPVLNYEDEALPLQHLQHAATSPKRILALLARMQSKPEKDRKIIPFSTTVIPLLDADSLWRTALHPDNLGAEQELLFVPGGRFIIVLSAFLSRLTVIDMDRYFDKRSKGNDNPSFAEYAVSVDCSNNTSVLKANISLDRNTLLIISSHFFSPDGIENISLWKYSPSSNVLNLKKTISISILEPETIPPCHMSSDLFLFMRDDILYTWDFINDKCICWQVDVDPTVWCQPQFFTDGCRIILLEFTNVKIWDIPYLAFEPLQGHHIPSIVYPPTLAFPTAISRAPIYLHKSDGQIVYIDDWYSGPKHPLIFDSMVRRFRDNTLYQTTPPVQWVHLRQQLCMPSYLKEHEEPSSDEIKESIVYTRLQDVQEGKMTHNMPSMLCEGQIIKSSRQDSVLFISTTPGRAEQDQSTEADELLPNELVSLGECDPFAFAFRRYSFDPCSGRLVNAYLDGTRVLISHYLRTPYLREQPIANHLGDA